MNTSPFAAIDQLLSAKGIEMLYNQCFALEKVAWFESEEGQESLEQGFYPTISEQDKVNLRPIVQSALVQKLEELIEKTTEEIDTRTFKIDTDKEREEFCSFMAKRLELTIVRWKSLPISKDHSDTFVLLDHFREHLRSLLTLWASDDSKNSVQSHNSAHVYQLPPNFQLTELNIRAKRLDTYQIALLFQLLRDQGVFINYSNESLAEIANILTGHSEQNIRGGKGFSKIQHIIEDKVKIKRFSDNENHNLSSVKNLLNDILTQVNSLISKNKEELNKKTQNKKK
ncbi:hypothetical protein [Rufibacter tibetensis]|uniref:Uncharacterized protein n=1 Tax=Rufibacter tibetensis TaxID=512763 RepID=A0A0N7HWD2_9BACT|nr:hypothetical protein [Rufibacter tibetensis]ALI98920.1 hypothetical protein DC20_07930 [Rufibacter tibetensis]